MRYTSAMSTIRQLECAHCGARSEILDDGLLMLCRFCGGVVSSRIDRLHGDVGMLRRAMASALDPSEAALRERALYEEQNAAKEAGDRRRHEAAGRELGALQLVLRPEVVPSHARKSAEELGTWVASYAASASIVAFDERIGRLAESLDPMELVRSREPLRAAESLLGRSVAYVRALQEHPDFVQSGPRADAKTMAKDLLRSFVLSAAPYLPSTTIRRVRIEALGDAADDQACACCGAELALQDDACSYCGAVQEVAEGDEWMAAMLRMWEVTGVGREGDRAPSEAVGLLTTAAYLGGELPDPVDAWRFVRRTHPGASRAALEEAAASLQHMNDPLPSYRVRLLNALSAS